MLSLHFKEDFTAEQNQRLAVELNQFFPQKHEFDVDGFAQIITVYTENRRNADKLVEKLKTAGFCFDTTFRLKYQIFHTDFAENLGKPLQYAHLAEIEQEDVESQENDENRTPDRKPLYIPRALDSPPPPPSPQFVTIDQIQDLTRQIKELAEETRRCNTMPTTPVSTVKSADFAAKNELIANGVSCEKCQTKIYGISPIGQLIMAVRDHVLTHFDAENPRLKRYECRECEPKFRTNFVNDMERHIKNHGSLSSPAEKRQKLIQNLLTQTHLQLIRDLCIACFPDVFDDTMPQIGVIPAIGTPVKAKLAIFPRLTRAFCARYKIPASHF